MRQKGTERERERERERQRQRQETETKETETRETETRETEMERQEVEMFPCPSSFCPVLSDLPSSILDQRGKDDQGGFLLVSCFT